jgi:hypothetical protein
MGTRHRQCPPMTTTAFFEVDFPATLYPLKTNLLMVKNHGVELSNYIYQSVVNASVPADSFLAQQKVFATKPKGHLRRTVKLDPVAEYFIYDVIFRNRAVFRPEVSGTRRSFGYRFKNGARIPVHVAYAEYKQHLGTCSLLYSHNIKFDIASYFNTLYHHDVAHWFASAQNVSATDSDALSQFCREINSGRSVDFLPHGIYPTKMIGNEFLKFIDLQGQIKCAQMMRFMDDFTLFDDDPAVLQRDFVRIQQLLGEYGLNVNPSKTSVDKPIGDVKEALTKIRQSLKEIVTQYEEVATESSVDLIETDTEVVKSLDDGQVAALLELLKDEQIEESDADLILGFLRAHSDSLLEQFPVLLGRFPNLIKHMHTICSGITDKSGLVATLIQFLQEQEHLLEYQLFWIGAIVEDYLLGVDGYGALLILLYEKSADHKIARAKVLETPESGFGLKEIRGEYLKTGQSDWLSWSSAAGSRSLKAGERNYVLGYFSKGSSMNHLIASCMKKL